MTHDLDGDHWQTRAACADVDPAPFHDEHRAAEARRICDRCDFVTECLADADVTGDRESFRGGLTAIQRARRAGRAWRAAAMKK